jgi:hypothetical protein
MVFYIDTTSGAQKGTKRKKSAEVACPVSVTQPKEPQKQHGFDISLTERIQEKR